jgi:hypothetical protein
MVLLGECEDAVEFEVGGFELFGFLFELFEGADAVIEEFVESFGFLLGLVFLFLESFEGECQVLVFLDL